MHSQSFCSNSPALRHRPTLVALFACIACLPAKAAALTTCRPDDSVLVCNLRSVLTFLNSAAILLGVLLLLAIVLAIRACRRKPRKISPNDITTDA